MKRVLKKVTALLLAGVMACSLAACGSNSKSDSVDAGATKKQKVQQRAKNAPSAWLFIRMQVLQ